MRSRVVIVVLVSCLVSSVTSFTDLEDNVVPDDSLQDLTVRIKKSPAEDSEKTSSNHESKSDSELTAVLTEDIKRKIDDLKELKNAYHKVEADFFGSESQTLKSSIEKTNSEILDSETKTSSQDSSAGSDDESVRTARQYFPSAYPSYQIQDQKYDSQKGVFPENSYSNGKYQSISSHPMDSSRDRDAPYIAQYNPSARTFDSFQIHKVLDTISSVTPISIPSIPTPPVEHKPAATPVHTAPPPVNVVLPASLPTVTIPEHKPYETTVHTAQPEKKVPLYFEKKEIGTPGSFFSKEIIFGPSKGHGEEHLPYPSYSSYPQGDVHAQPGYSPYPQGYPYGGSNSFWYAADRDYASPGYSSYPDPQAHYNYGAPYSPAYSYQQGPAYYPAGGAYRSNRDSSNQFQKYQDELDSLLSQFFRVGSDGGEADSHTFGNQSSVEQLSQDIEKEQKKIQILQEEMKTPKAPNNGSGVSQSFVDWLSGEIDAVYSRWIHLKDDMTKSQQGSGASTKEEVKVESV